MFKDLRAPVAGGVRRRGWPRGLLASLLAGALMFTLTGNGSLGSGLVLAARTCHSVTTSVSVPGGGSNLTIAGELCWNGTLAGKTLQVLTSGFTYDHTYWDIPYEPQNYSFVEAATTAGFATFNYDRLGVGDSDLPSGLPGSLSVANHAEVLHQLVQGARDGQLTGTTFTNVLAVGHSMGSAISIYEAGVYGDVDALLLTGNMNEHQPDFVGVPTYPAVDDPKFAGSGLPEEIVTTVPGEREDVFLLAGTSDPAVVDVDENLKATGALNEVMTIPTAYQPAIAGNVDVPVLFVVGQYDFVYCNTAEGFPCDTEQDILDRQAPMLPNAPCVDAIVIGGDGHSLNLHLQAQAIFAAVNGYDWQGCTSP